MTSTMIRPRSVGAESRRGADQKNQQIRLHKARIGLQLHYQPIRRLLGLGPQVCSMCDQRWDDDQETGLQGCPNRRTALADFVRLARPAELRAAVANGFLSEAEAGTASSASGDQQGRTAARRHSPQPAETRHHYPIDTGVMRA